MTMPAYAQELGGRLPSSSEKAAANQLRKILAAHAGGDATLRVLNDEKKRRVQPVIATPLNPEG